MVDPRLPRVVILDRDGTITRSTDLVLAPEQLEVTASAAEAIATLKALGVRVAIATNQGAVARGLLSETQLTDIHAEMQRQLGGSGAAVDLIVFCPHHPDAIDPADRACRCRKPEPGMLLHITAVLGVEPEKCVMIGDNYSDLEAARRARMPAVLVLTGHGSSHVLAAQRSGYATAPDLAAWVRNLSSPTVCLDGGTSLSP